MRSNPLDGKLKVFLILNLINDREEVLQFTLDILLTCKNGLYLTGVLFSIDLHIWWPREESMFVSVMMPTAN